jgi:hypothetical protein
LAVVLLGVFVLPWLPFARLPIGKLPLPPWAVAGIEREPRHALALAVCSGSLSDAIELVQTERARTRTERDAFDAFLNRVNEIPPTQEQPPLPPQQPVVGIPTAESSPFHQVRQAYEATVMDAPHYDEEYGDTVAASLAAEFGPDLATHLLSGQVFTPLCKEQLLQAARHCRRERDHFLSTLEREYDALTTTQTTLNDIAIYLDQLTATLPSDRQLGELIETYTWLDSAEQECEEVLEERQQQRVRGHAAVNTPRTTVSDLQTYLYISLPVTYPVLAETTELIATLRRTRRQLTRDFASRS